MKKQIITLLSLLFLVSCGTSENSSTVSAPEAVNKPKETEAIKETITATEEVKEKKTYTFTSENIPSTAQSKYNNDFEFSQDGFVLFGDFIQCGTGSYDKMIQMKKEISYFYSRTKATGTITLSVLDKGECTGIPSIYSGENENPSTAIEWESKKQESNAIIYQASFNGYFKISDESSFALYLNYIQIEA